MTRIGPVVAVIAASLPAALAYAALIGLGLHRHAPPFAISATATGLVFAPPLAFAVARGHHRVLTLATGMAVWSLFLLAILPVYFPGERRDAVATGIALVGLGGIARTVAARLPDDPQLARPEIPEASTMAQVEPPPARPLEPNEIPLPYEGEGRRLSVPVVFEHGGDSIEVYMMLDTGATYTTLPTSVLSRLGITPGPDDPVVELHTANGTREASIVLVDRVWLGDLSLDGVAVATCEQCAFSDTVGLLGLNVAGGFNMQIDADRREVVFGSRRQHDRRLDIKQFSELSATFTPYPGGRVEVEVRLQNLSPRTIVDATASVHCGDAVWEVEIGAIPPGELGVMPRRLPGHQACAQYEIGLSAAAW